MRRIATALGTVGMAACVLVAMLATYSRIWDEFGSLPGLLSLAVWPIAVGIVVCIRAERRLRRLEQEVREAEQELMEAIRESIRAQRPAKFIEDKK